MLPMCLAHAAAVQAAACAFTVRSVSRLWACYSRVQSAAPSTAAAPFTSGGLGGARALAGRDIGRPLCEHAAWPSLQVVGPALGELELRLGVLVPSPRLLEPSARARDEAREPSAPGSRDPLRWRVVSAPARVQLSLGVVVATHEAVEVVLARHALLAPELMRWRSAFTSASCRCSSAASSLCRCWSRLPIALPAPRPRGHRPAA